jgi:DNA-binding transcriptional LysR family regulator
MCYQHSAMDLRDLTYLHAIVDAGSITDAADRLGRTPPALTKAIRRLEDELGSRLFERRGRGIEPTEAARYLVSQTRGMSHRLGQLRIDVAEMASGRRGHVRIGVSATVAAIYLPQLLRRLSVDLPELRLTIVNGMNDVLRRDLGRGEIDLILGVYEAAQDDGLEGFHIARDEVRVVAAVGHPLRGRSLRPADLLDVRWVLPSRAVKMRQWLDAAFIARNLPAPQPHVETSSIAILETLIADSDFVTFVSSWKIGTRLVRNSLAALDVPELSMPREFGLVWSKMLPPTPSASVLIEYVRSMLRDPASNLNKDRTSP